MSKGARFWGFLGSRVRGVLGGISSILLDLARFGGQNLGYGVLLTVYFGTPSMFITLWFGFDY
jgi:hypothetical protein